MKKAAAVLGVMVLLVCFNALADDAAHQKEKTETVKLFGAGYTEYKEVVRDGHHYLVYIQLKDELESGWILHRKNCPCGWYKEENPE